MNPAVRGRRNRAELWKLGFFGALISAFVLGCAAGAGAFERMGIDALLVPIGLKCAQPAAWRAHARARARR
jgi:hypothetical protein